MYGSLWERVGKGTFLNRMFWACVNALETMVFIVDFIEVACDGAFKEVEI